MYISDYIGAPTKGHKHFDFVDSNIDGDNRLFIDPCMIEGADDPWSKSAAHTMQVFFDCMFDGFRSNTIRSSGLFDHAGEQNATKLGYGNGYNGKGKTADGLYDSLHDLVYLVHAIPTISCAQDVPVLVEGFAEDCMSDLLTNILHEHLNAFTCEQMEKWGCPPQGQLWFWTFSAEKRCWVRISRPCWYHRGKELLLVPKWIVRRNFLFKAHQYLYGVIIEHIRRENGWDDLTKANIWSNIPRLSEHWEYEKVISYSKEHPEALCEYHERMPRYYNRANGHMSDLSLDYAVYGYAVEEIA